MSLVVRTASPADLERLVPQLDQQFVFSRGRCVSLAQRFPAVYSAENCVNVFLLADDDQVMSALACKHFDWVCSGGHWRGAMIGAVHTQTELRGHGFASRLMEEVAERLRAGGVEFAVLWTAVPAFYARLGWISADRGVLGKIGQTQIPTAPPDGVIKMPLDAADLSHIERIRQRWCDCRAPRRADDYRQLPLPAESVDLIMWGDGIDYAGYALVGNAGETGILYEMIGHPDAFPVLWPDICRGYRQLLANDTTDSASYRWLCQGTGLVWSTKPLATWLPLSATVTVEHAARWYIPYFDRI